MVYDFPNLLLRSVTKLWECMAEILYIGHTENNMRGLTTGCNPKCLCIYVRDNEHLLLLLFYFSHTNAFVIFISIIYLHLFIFGSRVKFQSRMQENLHVSYFIDL